MVWNGSVFRVKSVEKARHGRRQVDQSKQQKFCKVALQNDFYVQCIAVHHQSRLQFPWWSTYETFARKKMSHYVFMFAKRMTMNDSTNILTRMMSKQNFIELHVHNLICLRRPWMSCMNFVNVVQTNVCEAVNNPKISNTLDLVVCKTYRFLPSFFAATVMQKTWSQPSATIQLTTKLPHVLIQKISASGKTRFWNRLTKSDTNVLSKQNAPK